MNVVIDTNLLLSAISSRSASHWLYQAIFQGRFRLCVTTDILNEYAEVITEKFRRQEMADAVLESIINSPFVRQVAVYYRWWLITVDPDDNKFVDCAIAAEADYVVTEDKHFDVLNGIIFPAITVVTLAQFSDILAQTVPVKS